MENRVWDQEVRRKANAKQNTNTHNTRGYIGDRSTNLIKLIGAERVARQDFRYGGTCYVTGDGEVYNKEDVINQEVLRTGIHFYEVANWEYNERKKLYQPIIRRIVIVKNTNTQLSLNL